MHALFVRTLGDITGEGRRLLVDNKAHENWTYNNNNQISTQRHVCLLLMRPARISQISTLRYAMSVSF